MNQGLVADMSQGIAVIYQGEVIGFGDLLEEATALLDQDELHEGEIVPDGPGVVKEESGDVDLDNFDEE